MAQGWAPGAPHDEVELLPLSDGGPGFLDVLARALGGTTVATTVSDPLGREVPAAVLVVERDGRRTAYVEAAQASGLHLLGADERDPGLTSTWGVGQLLEAAVEQGARKVVVGVGGSGTNDAGAGHARRARCRAGRRRWPAVALALALGARRRAARAADVLDRLAGVELVLATDDDTPLLGLQGTSAVEAPRKGASPEQAQALEGALGHFTDVVGRALPSARPSSCSAGCRAGSTARRAPGPPAGSATACSPWVPGGSAASRRCCASAASASPAARSDLVVTGAGRVDWSTLRGLGRRRGGRRHARDRAARPCSSRGSASSGGARRWPSGLAGTLRRRRQPRRGRGDGRRPGRRPWPPAPRGWRAPGRPPR